MERKVYIDYVKAIAITLVLSYHCHYFDKFDICKAILSFCCPLFFIVNGALLLNKKKGYDYFLPKIIKCLFLIFLWGTLSCICSALIFCEPYSVKQCIIDNFTLRIRFTNHLWFLYTIIILYMIYPITDKLIKDKKTAIISFFIISCFSLMGVSEIFRNCNPLKGWHSYALAYAIGGYVISNIDIKKKYLYWIFLLSILGQVVFNRVYSHIPDTDLIFYAYKSPFIMIAALCFVKLMKETKLKENRVIEFISKNTLGIYVVHYVFMTKMIVEGQFTNPVRYLFPFLVLFCSGLICFLMNKNKYTKFLITM